LNSVSAEQSALEELGNVDADTFTTFMDTQEITRTLLRPGEQDASSGDFAIRTLASNPAPASDVPIPLVYTIERTSGTTPVTYHWYLSPMNTAGLGDELHGHPRVETPDGPAYDLGTGDSASFPAAERNLYVVRCVVEATDGSRVDDVSYLQSVLDEGGARSSSDSKHTWSGRAASWGSCIRTIRSRSRRFTSRHRPTR
jgi:hypothetical protein